MKKVYDGVKLLVQFYANHGRLDLVEEKTGVPKDALQRWLMYEEGGLASGYRKKLEDYLKSQQMKAENLVEA